MTRSLLVLYNDEMRERAIKMVRAAPKESRLTFQGPKRTLDQNAKLHAMLKDVSLQRQLGGQWFGLREWKAAFVLALGHEMKMVPTIDENGFFPLGVSTSDLSIKECSDLIELAYAKGAEWGIVWSEPEHWHKDRSLGGSDPDDTTHDRKIEGNRQSDGNELPESRCVSPAGARSGDFPPRHESSDVPTGVSGRPPFNARLGRSVSPEVGSNAALKAPAVASSSAAGAKRRLTADEAIAMLPAGELSVMLPNRTTSVRWLWDEAADELRAAKMVGLSDKAPTGFPLGLMRHDGSVCYLQVH